MGMQEMLAADVRIARGPADGRVRDAGPGPEVWSTTDFPYQCLLDVRRTTALQSTIRSVVRPGDIVLDAGAGSGILSFFAAQAGAAKVYAVEVDPFLASCLARSIRANGLGRVVELLSEDVRAIRLPRSVDVFICEMMDTGLMDEMQVSAVNALFERGVITAATRSIPFHYETFIELGFTDFKYYGYTILAPKHDWPHYGDRSSGWLPTAFCPLTRPCRVSAVDLRRPIDREVDAAVPLEARDGGLVNAVRISARAHLAEGLALGATNALNGDKIVPIQQTRIARGQAFEARVSYRMGGGLGSLRVHLSP
jgi:predicted RNA methylase